MLVSTFHFLPAAVALSNLIHGILFLRSTTIKDIIAGRAKYGNPQDIPTLR